MKAITKKIKFPNKVFYFPSLTFKILENFDQNMQN